VKSLVDLQGFNSYAVNICTVLISIDQNVKPFMPNIFMADILGISKMLVGAELV